MDVRQFAFLARQPSAAVKSRSHFLGLPKRGLALILANAMFWQPLLAQADGIVVSAPGTGLAQAGNGVPIVNIAAPNANGLSHNQFHDYNVGANGVILNNATDRTQATQLGGIIVGNPNFKGTAANIILNEVNGGSPSQLRGYTEVAGQSAHVIVANPYGISCNGCGFINTPQATLTTGKAVIENGQISRYQVDQGSVAIEGAGLNATNVDQFEIITRATTINAQIQAKKLTIVAGRNDVDARTLNATARAADGSQAPDLAIDSSALGGMYVGAVKLVGTEAGVGVRLSGDMVAGGDIQIDAAGNVVMGQISAGTAINVKAQSVETKGAVYAGTDLSVKTQGALTNQQTLAAKDSITLDAAGRLTNNGIIEAGVNADSSRNAQGDVRLTAQALDNTGKTVIASRDLSINTGELANQRGTLSAQRAAQLSATQIDNQNQGRILSAGSLGINATQLLNSQGGLVTSTGNLTAGIGQLINRNGELSSQAQTTLQLAALDNVAGLVSAGQLLSLTATGPVINQHGTVRGDVRLDLKAGHVDNSAGGRISGGQALTASVASLDQHEDGRLFGQGEVSLDLNGGHLNNQGGVINAPGRLLLSNLNSVDNQGGEISSSQAFTLAANTLNNRNAKLLSEQALTVRIAQELDNTQGLVSANALDIHAGSLDNNGGTLSAGDGLLAQIDAALDNRNGKVLARTAVVSSATLDNRQGLVQGDATLNLTSQGLLDNRQGTLFAGQGLAVSAGSLDNSGKGNLYSQAGVSLNLNGGHLNNQSGVIHAPGVLLLSNLNSVDNQGGEISSAQALGFTADSLDNRGGQLLSEQGLLVRIAKALDNTKGLIAATSLDLQANSLINAEGELKIRDDAKVLVTTALDNRQGKIVAAATTLGSQTLDNSQGLLQGDRLLTVTHAGVAINRGGHFISGQYLNLNIDQFDNQGGEVSSVSDLSLHGKQFDNRNGGRLLANGAVQLNLDDLNNQQGTVRSDGTFTLHARTLNNDSGRLSSGAAQQLTTRGAISNRNGELLSAMALTLNSASLDNRGGKLIGDGAVRVTTASLNNQNSGRLSSAEGLDLTAGQVDNRFDGQIASNQALSASITGLDQRSGGKLYSLSDLSLDMNNGHLNNAGGLIHAPGQLLLKNLSTVANQGGEVSSEHAFTLAATSLDNSAGKLLSDQALTLKLEQALINIKGQISAAGLSAQAARMDNSSGVFGSSKDLALNLSADLLNDDGEVSSAGASVVNAMTLNNRNDGHVTGDVSLDLTTTGALFNQGGTLGSGQRLNVTAASLDNRQSGSLVSNGSLSVKVDGLLDNQAKGSVLAKGVVDIQAGSVDNRAGRLSGQNLLTLRSASLDNRGGAVRANQDLNLQVGQLDNRQGVLNSKQALAITGQSLSNQNGLASAVGPVRLTVDSVDNRAGEISSQQNIDLSGQRLDNSGGKLLAGTALELAMHAVINQAKGLVFAQDTRFTGTRLDNTEGTFGAKRSLALQLAAGLDNTGGKFTSEGSMDLAAQRIDNTGGSLSSAGPLTIASATALINQDGTVESAQSLKLTSASLDNTHGLIKSQGAASLATGAFKNAVEGHVTSADSLDLTATQVTNSGQIRSVGSLTANLTGLTQMGGAELLSTTQLNLDLHNGELVNAGVINAPILVLNNLGNLNNQHGEISSQNAFTLAANNLDNSHGKLISNQGLTLRVEQLLANVKGHINAVGLDARSTRLDNTDGLLSGRGDVAIHATERMDNQRGSVIADGDLLLTGAGLDNRNGEIAGKAQVTANIEQFDNQNGKLISTAGLQLRGANLDNRNGLVGATKALKLDVGLIDNRAGELTGNADVSVTGQQLNNSDKGVVFARGGLNLAVDQVINRALGELNGQRLSLTGTSLDNTGGKLLSEQPLVLELAGDLDNSQGVLSSEDALSVKARSLINNKGSLSSAQGLSVAVTGNLDNQDGKLVTDDSLTLHSASLGNQQGIISGKGPVVVSTGALNNQGGHLNSSATLALTTAQLNNGGSIGGEQGMTASVTGLDQQGGKLFSNAGLSLDLNNGALNNTGGFLNAKGPLLLNNLNTVTNQNGEISSGQAFTLAAQSLDNSNGKLLSDQGLTLRINQALTNLKGMIGAASLDARTAALDNRGGRVNSRGDLLLSSDGQLNNQDQGLINSLGTLNLTAAGLNTGNGGEVSAKGALAVGVNALAAAGGRIVGEQGVTLDLNNSDLDNRNGLLLANGPLTLKNLRDLNNQGGEISSQQGFSVTARSLDNTGGKLISSQTLSVNAGTLMNSAKGLLSGWQGLSVSGGNLDNRDHGTLSSRSGAIDVRLSGALQNNTEGALVSHGRLDVSAASLDNRGSGVLSSGTGQALAVTGALVNGDGGLIESGAELDVQAATLANQGTINVQQGFSFTGTDLSNNGGSLISNAQMTLDLLGNLNNSGGKLASAGPLLLKRANQVYNNADGKIISQSLLTLLTGGLNNSERGTLAGKERVVITSSGVVQNQTDGLIYSQDADVQLNAASLNNAKGKVQGQTGLGLTVSGDVNNQGGKLVSARGLDLRANRIDNQSGRIAAQTGDAVVNANYFANANGGLYAKGLVRVGGQTLDNSSGQIGAGTIDLGLSGALRNQAGIIESDTTLNLLAGDVDNVGGQLRALGSSGKTTVQVGGQIDNRNGQLETSNSDFTLTGSLQNQGGSVLHGGTGTFDIATANLTRAGGNVVTRGGLTLTADNWTNSSVIQAGRLTVNVNTLNQTAGGQLLASQSLVGNGGNWNNDGLIASDGSVAVQLAGGYEGNGRISSVGTLNLSAAQMTLKEPGSLAGGGASHVSVGGQLSNRGRLTSGSGLRIDAGSVVNTGTLGAAQNLDLTAQSLLNDHVAGDINARGFVFSGQDATFNVGSLTNNYSDIYSLGNLTMAGVAGGTAAQSIRNISASIESMGDLRLSANDVVNEREKFQLNQRLTSVGVSIRCTQHCSGGWSDRRPAVTLSRTVESVVEANSPSATLSAGRNMVIAGQNFTNRYSVVSAANDLSITGENIQNLAATGGSGTRSQEYGGVTKIGKGQYNQMVAAVQAYNRAHPQGSPVDEAAFAALMTKFSPSLFSGINAPIPVAGGTQVVAPAIIQAGGNAQLIASKNISNITVLKTALGVGGRALDTGVGANKTQVVVLNAQLPPDLAQQQVNPLTLPGFGLPSGQNGLFRLSGQGGTSGQATGNQGGAQTWTLGSASIDPATRDQARPENQGRTIQVEGAALVTASTHQIALTAREAGAIDAVASAINIDAVGSADVQTLQPGRSSGGDITHVAGIDAHNPAQGAGPAVGATDLSGLAAADRDARAVHTALTESDGARPDLSDRGTNVAAIAPQTAVGQPTPLTSQTFTRVQGLPDSRAASQPHKYLIETNPVLTDLKQFMSSDYLLQGLGYNPDQSWKRLGDGLYEQRLVQQAVQARTGQRFIDGQNTDEKLFKYLMDNAISSKQQLNLSMGVSLTSQQVAALTHDIVWLEQHEVNGEKVLVPVLYLAQANNRLAPNGALIAGNDLNLIAGENLVNAGTLRANNNLSAKAANDLTNSGLIEAGNRLDLLAGNNIVNKAGGIIAGRDVTMTAINGDVINERSVTGWDDSGRGYSQHRDYVDSAARVEAANDLDISAGKDVASVGGVLHSGRDTTIVAGRDASLASAEERNATDMGRRLQSSNATQYGSSVEAGRDINVKAGRDITAIASQIDAKRDINMSAGGDMFLASAADEQHSSSKSKKEKRQEDHVSQVSTALSAGGDVSLSAGKDLGLIASRISAGDEAYLVAGGNLALLSAEDSDYSLYDMKKKGSWGSKKTQRDEVTKVTHIGSEIKTGGDLTIQSQGDQKYQAAKLDSGNDLTIASGGSVTFEGVKDLDQESHAKSKSSLAWNSMSGKGNTDETLRQTQMVAKGEIAIKAVDGLHIDVKQVNQQTVSQAIDAMVKADPQMAWLKDAEKRGDVDWKLIKETHDSYKYSNSSLGQGAMLAIIIIVTVLTAGAASGAVGTAFAGAGTAGSGTAMAAAGSSAMVSAGTAVGTAAAGWGNAMATAALTSLASGSAVSFINNGGNLGATLKDVTSSNALKGYATSALTAGFTTGVIDPNLGGTIKPFNNLTKGFDLKTLEGIGGFAVHAAAQGVAAGTIQTVVGGGNLGKNVTGGLVSQAGNVVAATAFNYVGSYAQDHWQAAKNAGDTTGMAMWAEGGSARVTMHALFGGAVASATGGDFKTGAIAAGASQAMAQVLNDTFDKQPELRQAFAQVVGLTAAGLAGGDVNKASWVSQMADQYNRQLHQKETLALEALQKDDPANAYKLKAAACALVHCSASVPTEDPNYKYISELESDGGNFKDAQKQLLATGAFDEYGRWDKANDKLLKNDEALTRSGNASRAVLGAIGAAAGFGGAALTAPACVTVVGCAAPALSGLGGALSFHDGMQATGALLTPYQYTQGSKVLASFSMDTYPGDVNPIRDYGTAAARAAIEIALFKGAGKLAEGKSLLLTGEKTGSKVTPSGLVSGETRVVGTGKTAANDASFDGAKATGGAAGKVDDLASTATPVRPTPQKSEIDVGADLGAGARPQVSYKNGQEVPYGTSGSVRPDWCVGNVCSVEVKNYNIAKNQSGLISNVSKQALQRAENLPQGMQQQVVIDIRGQAVTPVQRAQIVRGIVDKSNGAISPSSIRFKAE
ncbi:filamentous hemagglutinin N-terminal domain-containing protein [Pseudomonas sp. YeP6b]|uniref:two-partner secretion domain-containing protein n=3 Tax=Pseudomonas TaxID=286 RepID=UPI0021DA8343|nr:filamentous hemagglutinin N-terminal domain-containing protein [Pseudomonas sp. YeP6b]UXZ20945.1 filamentous hemagglutinin N-terminal domain-containing protein [Pseudomonas sp. YeP6b]